MCFNVYIKQIVENNIIKSKKKLSFEFYSFFLRLLH